MACVETHRLVPHAACPPAAVERVEVGLGWTGEGALRLIYRVAPAASLRLAAVPPGRSDGLWRHSCFELFVREGQGPAYREFNFAPPAAWAAYRFASRRHSQADLALAAPPRIDEPALADAGWSLALSLDGAALPPAPGAVALCAVIEEAGGTKSYWALVHAAATPDFHDPACFAIELPPRGFP